MKKEEKISLEEKSSSCLKQATPQRVADAGQRRNFPSKKFYRLFHAISLP